MALGTAASGPSGHFLRLINSGDLNKYKFNQTTRSIHVFTFRETQNPDRLDTFDFGQKASTLTIFCQKVDNINAQFHLKFRSRNKKVMPY
jgi:hypothetical protein